MATCQRCGATVPEGMQACPQCGMPVIPAAQPVQPQALYGANPADPYSGIMIMTPQAQAQPYGAPTSYSYSYPAPQPVSEGTGYLQPFGNGASMQVNLHPEMTVAAGNAVKNPYAPESLATNEAVPVDFALKANKVGVPCFFAFPYDPSDRDSIKKAYGDLYRTMGGGELYPETQPQAPQMQAPQMQQSMPGYPPYNPWDPMAMYYGMTDPYYGQMPYPQQAPAAQPEAQPAEATAETAAEQTEQTEQPAVEMSGKKRSKEERKRKKAERKALDRSMKNVYAFD